MKILLINHYAGSRYHGMEYRPYYFAREWVRAGHEATIVAASESHVRVQRVSLDCPVRREDVDGIRYIWLKTPPYNGNGFARVRNIMAFVLRLRAMAGRLADELRPDAVIASSTYPLDIVPARSIARRAGARLAYEVHDLWPLSPIELGGMSPGHPFIRLMQWAENTAYRSVDEVISMLPNAAVHMTDHGMAGDKFNYVPNGVNLDEWSGDTAELPEEHRAAFTTLRADGRFVIGYAGAHGVANALGSLLDAAEILADTPATFVLVGQGPEKPALQTAAAERRLKNVVFLPPVPKEAVPSLMQWFDVAYIGLQTTPLFRFGVSPNKLMDYMMAARPVLHAIDAGNDLVVESGCGISVPPEDPEAVCGAVRRFLAMSPQEREQAGRRGREYVREHHDYRVLARRCLEILQADGVRAVVSPAQPV